ncbi:hypothetical protein, partial [Xylophilus sp. ASV27]|uniref:hypothetical protein n=1 Tax=Xylophilus sp. ASV27 TaxID=2795129 RepID=UPI00351C8F99
MPFKITAARSAQLIVRAIKSGRRQYYFPFTMGILSRINSIIPNFFYDFLMGKFAGPVAKNPKLLSSLT